MSVESQQLKQMATDFINKVDQIEIENKSYIKSKEALEKTINDLMQKNKDNAEALDIATHAIEILREVSDNAVSEAYGFLQESINSALAKMFTHTTRYIEIHEYTRNNQYPQLELILHVGKGKTRSLKSDSGHGIAQVISILSILSLIVITGSRRILVMDEVLSGLSSDNRRIVNDIMWSFTEIGFQFIVNDHGFIPKGSHLYFLEMVGDVSGVKYDYIEPNGVYLSPDTDDSGETVDDDEVMAYIHQQATGQTVNGGNTGDSGNNTNVGSTTNESITPKVETNTGATEIISI